jgi:hypothetical protein
MHDFDAERAKRHAERAAEFGEKPFKFGGEVFYVRPNVGYLSIKRVAALSEASTGEETFSAIEESVISMIDPRDNSMERFLSVTRSNEDPITFDDLVELQGWLIQEQTGRPPTQDESSASTPTSNGTPSTENSSTELGEVSTT